MTKYRSLLATTYLSVAVAGLGIGCSHLRLSPEEEAAAAREWRTHAEQYLKYNSSTPLFDRQGLERRLE